MTSLQDDLRRALPGAMKAKDPEAVSALRAALSAIDNAEAVDAGLAGPAVIGRNADVERRLLTETDVRDVVTGEVRERQEAVTVLRASGEGARADALDAGTAVLAALLEGQDQTHG